MEGNIKNLPLVIIGGRTINSAGVDELRRIKITVVGDYNPLEENIPYGGAIVIEGGIYDGQVWVDDGRNPSKAANHHSSDRKLTGVIPSINTDLTLLD